MHNIGLQIPLANWDDFALAEDFEFALTDFILNDPEYKARYVEMRRLFPTRECWLDNSFNEEGYKHGISNELGKLLQAAMELEPTHIVTCESIDPDENLSLIDASVEAYRKEFGFSIKIVGVWRGTHLHAKKILQAGVDLLALPYDEPRELLYHDKELCAISHFLGFRGTWETDTIPMRGIDTDAPILAAVNGVNFSHFKGRPLGLKKYDPSIKLTKAEVALALHNLDCMRPYI